MVNYNKNRTSLLVTGASGQLGTDLVEVLGIDYEVTGAGRADFDITDLTATENYLTQLQPDLVIHSAAYTDVDGCEKNEEKAFRVNGLGARNVAIAAREVGARLVYVSTDYVFDGKKQDPYREYNDPNPESVYGKSKLLGERFVKQQLPEHYICRTAWLYGEHEDNFVKSMLDLVEEKEKLEIIDDQFGTPTWSRDVAKQIRKLISLKAFGTYHCSSLGSCSWYQFALEIFKHADYQVVSSQGKEVKLANDSGGITKVEPVPAEEFARPAPRPKNSVLENYMFELQGFNEMPHWKDSLEKFLEIR